MQIGRQEVLIYCRIFDKAHGNSLYQPKIRRVFHNYKILFKIDNLDLMNMNIHQLIITTCSILLVILSGLNISSNCYAQVPHFTQLYSIEDGLDQRIVRTVLRDKQYKTWVFSDVGAQLYDGKGFEHLNILDSINMDDIYQIDIVDSLGILLLGKNISYKINTQTEKLSLLDQKDHEFLYVTNGILVAYDKIEKQISVGDKNYKFKEVSSTPKKIITHNHEVNILTESSTMHIQNNQNKGIQIEGVTDVLGYINDQCFYIKNDTLYRFHNGVHHPYPSKISKIKKGLIKYDKSGNVLLGLGHHRSRITELHLYTQDGIENYDMVATEINTIRDFYSDDFRKEILLATYNGMIYQSFSPHISNVHSNSNSKEGDFGHVTWWIINRTKTDELYFARQVNGVFKYKNNELDTLFDPQQKSSIYESNYFGFYDENNDLLLSSSFKDNNGLYVWDFENDVLEIKCNIRIRCFTKLNENQIILAGAIGKTAAISIYDIKEKKITKNYKLEGLLERIYSISIDEDVLTFTTDKNISTLTFDLDNFDNNIFDVQNIIEYGAIDHKFINNYLVVGTYGDGVYIIDNNKVVKHLNVSNGLAGNIVHSVNEDSKGYIWLGTFKGISVLDSNFNIIKNIRKEDGLSTNDLNTHSFAEINNQIFVGSINGMNIIDPEILKSKPYSNLIPEETSYTKNGVEYSQKLKHAITPNIPFEIDTINVKFKDYRLYRSFNNRDYIFENELFLNNEKIALNNLSLPVIIDNNIDISKKIKGQQVVLLSFSKESLLEKFGLIIILLCIVISLIYLLFKLNNKRISDKHQKRLLAMQTRLDNMRSSALRAQMNPHFIFNALGSIQYYIQRQETDLAQEYLSDFAVLMRGILDSSKEDFIKISEEIQLLKLYVKLEHLRFDRKFNYTFEIGEEHDLTFELPSMIIQPFIENAINHGLYYLDNNTKGLLKISMHEDELGQILCIIEDNGVGRSYLKKGNLKKHKSRAIGIINDRMAILSEQTNQSFNIDIVDLFDGNKPIGTRVIICFGFYQ